MKRILASAAALAAITVITIPLGVGWYYAGKLQREALTVDREPVQPDLTVSAVSSRSITLHVSPATDLAYGAWRTSGAWRMMPKRSKIVSAPLMTLKRKKLTTPPSCTSPRP